MADIKKVWLLYAKGTLMLLVGILASILLLLRNLEWSTVILLSISIWGFCRAYYFAFYVIENYIDRSYRYAGLFDFIKYSIRRRFH